jgi:hypothetical protein
LSIGLQALEQVENFTSTIYNMTDYMQKRYPSLKSIWNDAREIVSNSPFNLRKLLCILHSHSTTLNVRTHIPQMQPMPVCHQTPETIDQKRKYYDQHGANCICHSAVAALTILNAL